MAELGYEWIELPPREDFIPFFRHPRVGDGTVAKFRKALESAGVGISSVLPLFRWSHVPPAGIVRHHIAGPSSSAWRTQEATTTKGQRDWMEVTTRSATPAAP